MEAGNVLLHAAGISNDDVPSAPCFEWLRVKGEFVGGFGIWASLLLNLSPHYRDQSANLLTSDETYGECGVSPTAMVHFEQTHLDDARQISRPRVVR
jgi:hypothetical protein